MTSFEEEANILYELLVHAEWPLEQEVIGGGAVSHGGNFVYRTLTKTPANIWAFTSSLWAYVRASPAVSPSLSKLVGGGSGWQLGVGAQGAVVAIVQAATLEIRAKKDDFASVVGRNTNLYSDPYPSWRRVAWSADCSMVGVAYSSGAVEIFDTLGTSIFTIYPPRYQEGAVQVDTSNAIAALVFSDVRTQKIKWASELIIVGYNGDVRSYYVSPTEGYQESHVFSFRKMYPQGLTAVVHNRNFLVVAGSCDYVEDNNLKNNGLGHGITVWRMLNDYPFYKQVATIDEDEYVAPSLGLMGRLPWFRASPQHDIIFHMCISPNGRQLAALHTSGSLSIWEFPSLRKKKYWALENQPDHDEVNVGGGYVPGQKQRLLHYTGPLKYHPAGISWWSDVAVILARFSGAVTVSSVNSLRNLLGESPEFLEGIPQISEAYERGFLALEVESRVNTKRVVASEGSDEEDDYIDSDDEDELSIVQRSSRLAKSALFWVTDAERFRPASKRPKIVQRTFRLLCLKSTTPEELFARKIESEEYGEALALARSYSLDCDLVYQQQWRRSPVTVASIQDYLAKIRKRSWVLAECLTRVPDNLDAARELLIYGLRGTDLEAIVAIGKGTDKGEFILCDADLLDDDDADDADDAVAQERQAQDLRRRHQYLTQIDFNNLSTEQKNVIRARQKLLCYLDRLDTYEVLLGGTHVAPDHYDPAFFEKFRNQSIIWATVEFARNYDWRGVEAMFTYHGVETLPHRLAILSNFPPTMGPFEYRSLLPECEGEDVFDWDQEQIREEDWSEDPISRNAINEAEDDPAAFLYEERPELAKFRGRGTSGEVVSAWYRERAREIERCSHFVDAALDLLKLGRERNVQNLEELHDTLDSLEVMVYEVGLCSITLDQYSNLSHAEKIVKLMSTSTPETYIQNVRRWLLPFLARCEKWRPGSYNTLLREYVVSTATQDLGLALKLLQHSRPDQHQAIISDPEDMMAIALQCVYACEKESQLPRAFAILECLPERESGAGNSEALSKLHDLADAMEAHLTAAELLSNNSVCMTPSQLRDLQDDPDKVRETLTKLTRAAARREPRLSDDDWRKLLYEMLELQQKVFKCVQPQVCSETLTEALLCSGVVENIVFAGELLETRSDRSPVHNPYLQQLPFGQAVQLVTAAATQYFNSSENHADQAMGLAQQCLSLIECDNEDVKKEKDLIAALQILPEFGINKLPLQVRLCEDRVALIEEGLVTSKGSYRHAPRLLHLAQLLRVCGTDARARQAKVLSLVAHAALKAGDYVVASGVCEQLVAGEHHEGWRVCQMLGAARQYANLQARARLLNFALTHAPPAHLEELLNARNEVEMALVYARLNTHMDASATADTDDDADDDDDGFVDAITHQEDGDETGGGLVQGTLGVTRSVLSVTASTTSNLVTSMASKSFWKAAVNWMRPLQELSSAGAEDEARDTNAAWEHQSCHAFYADLIPDHHVSTIGASYRSYAPDGSSSAALEFSMALLRIALIQETLTHGATINTSDTVVSEVARAVVREDLPLGLCLLLLLRDPQDAHAVLASLPRTDVSLQLSQYYYGVRIYSIVEPWTRPGIADVFLHEPAHVIQHVTRLVHQLDTSDPLLAQLADLFRGAGELAADYAQGQALQRLGTGVDINRFLVDGSYKEDTVLGLAMTHDDEVLGLALTLARKYDVSLWQVHMTYLQNLFDSELSTADIKNAIDAKDLVKILSKQPRDFINSMESTVLLTVNGCDHERLLLYYTLIQQCGKGEPEHQSADAHIKLLKKIKGSAKGLNYKLLLKPDTDVMAVLRPVLTAQNVTSLAKLARTFPNMKHAGVQPSKVYCAWAQKHFLDVSTGEKTKTTKDWLNKFKSCDEYLQKMVAEDAQAFVRRLVLAREGSQLVPLDARTEIANHAIHFCRDQATQEDGARWAAVATTVEGWRGHLELLRCQTFQALTRHPDPRLQDYAAQFGASDGSEAALRALAVQVLLDRAGLEVLRELLTAYPDTAECAPEDVLMQAITVLIHRWRGLDPQVEVDVEGMSEVDQVSLLDHLLEQVGHYLDDGGDLISEEEVMGGLRDLGDDATVPLDTRVQALTLAEKHLSLCEDDQRLVRVLRTGNVVARAWPREDNLDLSVELDVALAQVSSPEGRTSLLNKLVSETNTLVQGEAVIELLKLWPPFNQEDYDSLARNPWVSVFARVLEVNLHAASLDVIWAAVQDAITLHQVGSACLGRVVELLGCAEDQCGAAAVRTSVKVALLGDDADLHHTAITNLTAALNNKDEVVADIDYDSELLGQVVDKGFVAEVLPTILYGPLVTFLMEGGSKARLSEAVKQLEKRGHSKEAASLAMMPSSVPKSLQTISAVLNTYRKWL